ncbi:MAG: GTPase Era [Erysipelotrichaceae bacterium]
MAKSGFVAIVGRPNAGKSTLLNQILKQKVAIISNKPQTTRNAIRGIFTDADAQIVFIDTPGIHKPHHQLGKRMNKEAYAHASGVDLIYLIIDANEELGGGDEYVLNKLNDFKAPVFLLINKIDLVSKETLIKLILKYQNKYDFKEIIPISALSNDNVDKLLELTKANIEEGEQFYPLDMVADYPEQFIISEVVREKVLILTEQEIPHSVAVVIERIVKKRDVLSINAMILVERNSQKAIIIGKAGNMIKKIGQMAREDLEIILGNRIYLELFVRVEKDWRNKERRLKELGYIDVEID